MSWKLRSPSDFDTATKHVRPKDMREPLLNLPDLAWYAERFAAFVGLGFDGTHLPSGRAR